MIKLGNTELHYRLAIKILRSLRTGRKLKILEIGAGPKTIQKFLPSNLLYHTMDNAESFWKTSYTYTHDLDAGKFPIKNESYDIIICHETLEHVKYPERVIKEILRISSKEALFFFSMPNEYNFISRLYFLMGKKTEVEEPFKVVEKSLHIHRPRVKDILGLFSKYFRIKKVDYTWQSRLSEKSAVAGAIDKGIMRLASSFPGLFARTVSVFCVKK